MNPLDQQTILLFLCYVNQFYSLLCRLLTAYGTPQTHANYMGSSRTGTQWGRMKIMACVFPLTFIPSGSLPITCSPSACPWSAPYHHLTWASRVFGRVCCTFEQGLCLRGFFKKLPEMKLPIASCLPHSMLALPCKERGCPWRFDNKTLIERLWGTPYCLCFLRCTGNWCLAAIPAIFLWLGCVLIT